MAERYLSEREMARVIELAARLQEQALHREEDLDGKISVTDLRRVAQEAGIRPEYIDEALRQPTHVESRRKFLALVEEHRVEMEGEIANETFDEVVELLAQQGRFQAVVATSRTQSYLLQGWLAGSRVEVSSRKGRTRLSLRHPPVIAYLLGLHLPVVLSFSLGLPLLIARIMPAWTAAGLIVALLSVGWVLFRVINRHTRSMASELFARLSGVISGQIETPSLDPAGVSEQPLTEFRQTSH